MRGDVTGRRMPDADGTRPGSPLPPAGKPEGAVRRGPAVAGAGVARNAAELRARRGAARKEELEKQEGACTPPWYSGRAASTPRQPTAPVTVFGQGGCAEIVTLPPLPRQGHQEVTWITDKLGVGAAATQQRW